MCVLQDEYYIPFVVVVDGVGVGVGVGCSVLLWSRGNNGARGQSAARFSRNSTTAAAAAELMMLIACRA